MSDPVRIQLKRSKGWKMPENTVKVDRSGPFGNPFPVVAGRVTGLKDGVMLRDEKRYFVSGVWNRDHLTKGTAAAEAVTTFRKWIEHPAQRKQRDLAVFGLRGKNLACWCPIGAPCHADVLLELANRAAA